MNVKVYKTDIDEVLIFQPEEFTDERDSHLAELITQIREGLEAQEGMSAFLQKRSPSWSKE